MAARKGPKPTPLDWANCGTEANYARHRRLGEQPCRACRAANAQASATRKVRRGLTPGGRWPKGDG